MNSNQATIDMTGCGFAVGDDDAIHLMELSLIMALELQSPHFLGASKSLTGPPRRQLRCAYAAFPSGPPSGSYTVRKADQHIRLEGGIFDYYNSGWQ